MRTFIVYLSEEKQIAISAGNWEKSEDSLIFTKTDDGCKPKILAVFNFNNIIGFCEC